MLAANGDSQNPALNKHVEADETGDKKSLKKKTHNLPVWPMRIGLLTGIILSAILRSMGYPQKFIRNLKAMSDIRP